MDAVWQQILDSLRKRYSINCKLIHLPGDTPGYSIDSSDHNVITITVTGAIDERMYVELPGILSDIGVKIIELQTEGEWLGDGESPRKMLITDHVACHSVNPLTGTDAAGKGDAFVDLHGAYKRMDVEEGLPEGILWHSISDEPLPDDERVEAIRAGCQVAGNKVAPWVTGARAAGLEIRVVLDVYRHHYVKKNRG